MSNVNQILSNLQKAAQLSGESYEELLAKADSFFGKHSMEDIVRWSELRLEAAQKKSN